MDEKTKRAMEHFQQTIEDEIYLLNATPWQKIKYYLGIGDR